MYPLNFHSSIRYLRNKRIEEYDMKSGGYSVTLSESLIDDEDILKDLALSDKFQRQIILGLYARDNREYTKSLHKGFQKYIEVFTEYNDIEEDDIISINKDSITFYNHVVSRTSFKKVKFTKRGDFTSYLKLGQLEFYINSKTKETKLKGIALETFEETLIEEVFKLLFLSEVSKREHVQATITEIRQAYVELELTDNYYKELSPRKQFRLTDRLSTMNVFSDYPFSENDNPDLFVEKLDITYNYRNIIMPLCDIFM